MPSSPLTTVTVSYPAKLMVAPFIGMPSLSVIAPVTSYLNTCVSMKSTVILSPALSVTCSLPIDAPCMYFTVMSYSPAGIPVMV